MKLRLLTPGEAELAAEVFGPALRVESIRILTGAPMSGFAFVLWTLASWVKVAASGGYGRGLAAYRYSIPFVWDRLNLEQQARVVEHGWLLQRGVRTAAMPDGAVAGDYAAVAGSP